MAEDRQALVIGNSGYEHSRKLRNPVNDARAIGETLRVAGFLVTTELDATHEEMEGALKRFSRGLSPSSTALLYYAGHGMQVNGRSYLLPVDAEADAAEALKYEAVALDMVLDLLDRGGKGAGLKILILDCCRDNPFGRSWSGNRSANGMTGLAAPASTPQGTILCFATDPGKVAKDGRGTNSPYTTGLVRHLFTPGLDIDLALRRAGSEVQKVTRGAQNPWRNSNFNGLFAFVPEGRGEVVMPSRPRPVSPSPSRPGNTESMEGSRAGEERSFGGIDFVWCPPTGEEGFLMGSPESEESRHDDEKQHRVMLSKGFWLAKMECTQGQYEKVMGENPSHFSGSSNLPVENVSWEDATAYCEKLNREVQLPSGWKFTLPTEAQWEYGCRAGTSTPFHFGSVLNGEKANCDGNYPYGTSVKGPDLEKTSEAGSYGANGWGLCDMHGNVWEWCLDWFGEDYYTEGQRDPTGPTGGSFRVSRGGSRCASASGCRAAFRNSNSPSFRLHTQGFRVAVSSTQ